MEAELHKKEDMVRLFVVCPVFREKRFCERWYLLTQLYQDVDVTLLAPRYWKWKANKSYSLGRDLEWQGADWEDTRFRVRLVDMPQTRVGWFSLGLIREMKRCQPDMVYYIGHDMEYSLVETILAARMLVPRAKVAAFTMRGLPHDFSMRSVRVRWSLIQKYCDALFCHYPAARQLITDQGYSGAIYVQTQIGVDANIYRHDEHARAVIRQKYGLGDSFVFGSATRLTLSKGILDILRALPSKGNWRYLMLGSGPVEEEQVIRDEIARLRLGDRVMIPGLIDWPEMPAHLSAMDCMLHLPHTTPEWIDTFPVAVVQAMAASLPVIGNTSGAVPYQLGEEGIIVPEGDIDTLREAMLRLMNNPDETKVMGCRLRKRVLRAFDITHLNHCFHSTMMDVISGVFDPGKIDMAHFSSVIRSNLDIIY